MFICTCINYELSSVRLLSKNGFSSEVYTKRILLWDFTPPFKKGIIFLENKRL